MSRYAEIAAFLRSKETWNFIACAGGLQVSYLIWGLLQEELMSQKFNPTPMTPSGKFPSATFCVFSNRLLAIILAFSVCIYMHGTASSSAPLLAFTPCSLSNTISSWSQYKALNYVTFSMQTIFKSTKVIPVMIMGTVLQGTNYNRIEYAEALAITMGVAIFGMNKEHRQADDDEEDATAMEEYLGLGLLCSYVLCDAFTSQWQARLYKEYGKIDQWHMMFGVNVSSIAITVVAMTVSNEWMKIFEFFYYNPTTLWFNIFTAICSATGQVAIFTTIRLYGPLVFSIIMTTRQVFSIVLSNIIFGHHLTAGAYVGAMVVFGAIFHSVHRKRKEKVEKAEQEKAAVLAVTDGENDEGAELASLLRGSKDRERDGDRGEDDRKSVPALSVKI